MSESENMSVTRSAGVVGISTLLSRVLGLVRDMVMSGLFGAGPVAEAFWVAFMIPNTLRRMVGEGSLTVAFVSVYTKFVQETSRGEAVKLAQTFMTLMTIVLAGLTLAGIAASEPIVALFTHSEYQSDPEKFALAVSMTRQMFAYLFLIGLVALSMGILNSFKHFFAPAFHPVLLNLGWIGCVVLLHNSFEQPGMAAVIGVLVGGALQLLLQIPFLWRYGIRFVPSFNFRHPMILRVFKLWLPSLVAVGISDINAIVALYLVTAFAGGRSHFYYSNRLSELPYALVALALATAILPTMSEQAGKKDHKRLAESLSYGLRMTAFLIIPATLGLILLSEPIVNLIYERGAFSHSDTLFTARALVMFGLGLWAIAGYRLIVQVFYSLEDMVTPLYGAAASMVFTIVGGWTLSGVIGHAGVPLALSLAAMLNLSILTLFLLRRLPEFSGRSLGRIVLKSSLACLPLAAVCYYTTSLGLWQDAGNSLLKTALLLACITLAGLLYFLAAWLLKCEELDVAIEALRRRLGRSGS